MIDQMRTINEKRAMSRRVAALVGRSAAVAVLAAFTAAPVRAATFAPFPDGSVRIDAAILAAAADVPAGTGVVYDPSGNSNDIKVVNFGTTIYTGPINVASTIARVAANQSVYQNESDDGGFFNFNPGELPNVPRMGMNYYMEFMVWPLVNLSANTYDTTDTPYNSPSGVSSGDTFPGPERILIGSAGEVYYTGDHYSTNDYVYPTSPLTSITVNSWNSPTGSWSTATNWAGGHVPVAGEAAYLSVADENTRTVTYDYTGPAVKLGDFLVNADGTNTSHGSMTFHQTQGILTTAKEEVWARYGTASVYQNGGTTTVNGTLQIGALVASTGVYNLASGTLSTANEYIGSTNLVASAGTGIFLQSGGTHNVSGSLNLGFSAGGTGVYQLQGGNLTAGSVNINAGGTFNLGLGTLTAGSVNITSTGLFNWTGGNLSLTGSGSSNIGGLPSISALYTQLSQTAGSLTIPGDVYCVNSGVLTIASSNSSSVAITGGLNIYSGHVNLSGGSLSVSTLVNCGSSGCLNWTGGTLIITNSSGEYLANDGTNNALLNLTGSKSLIIDGPLQNNATLNLSGGSLSVGSLVDNAPVWTTGTLDITGSAGLTIGSGQPMGSNLNLSTGQTLSVTNLLTNNGTITVNGGSIYYGSLTGNPINWISGQLTASTVNGPITIGANQSFGSTNVITTITATGSLNLSNGGTVSGSISNAGTFITSGNFNVPNGGLYNQTGGSTTINGDFGVGVGGTTATTSISFGNFTADEIILGNQNGSGNFVTSGSANVKVIRGIQMNDYTQNGGTTTVLGQNPDDGGDPELTGAMVGGYQHNGAMYLNGGTASTVDLKLGITAGMTGTYQQTSGVMTISDELGVGYDPLNGGGAGVGIAGILGGTTNTVAMQIGSAAGGAGTLTIASPGVFNVSGSAQIVNGSMNQTGGTVNYYSALTVGTATAASGIYNLTGGPAAISGYLTIATGGTFNQNGGTVNVTGTTGNYLYDSGTYLLQTGDLQAAGEYLQSSTHAVFIQTGGTQEMASFVSIAPLSTDAATYQVSGGTLTTNGLDIGCSPFTPTTPGGSASFTLSAGAMLNLSGQMINFGTLILGGMQNYSTGALFINNTGATAAFTADAGSVAQTLNVNVIGGLVNFNTSQHLASLNISGGTVTLSKTGSTRSVLYTPSLSVTGTLDLTGNDLDIQNGGSTALATITAMIKQGFNNGAWTGAGITSTLAANNSTHLTAIGVILNNQSGAALYTTGHLLDGFASTAANDVLVKYTYYGDANLDGKVDGSDYSLIDNGYLNGLTGWFNGDFNYDGVVDGSDYTLIDNAFNSQETQLTAEIAAPLAVATAQIAAEPSAVPEPTSTTVLAITGISLLARRRRVCV
jgi:hypothetical protein